MAHNTLLDIIDFSTCPSVPTNLVPGRSYRLTGLSQGALGDYDVVAIANENGDLSANVLVYPDGASSFGWVGLFDYATCQLTWLRDPTNNDIGLSFNISNFKWFDANVSDNKVDFLSTLILTADWTGIFVGNTVIGAYVDLAAIAEQTNNEFIQVQWDSGGETNFGASAAPNSRVKWNYVHVGSASTINTTGTSDLVLLDITLDNRSVLNINTSGTVNIQYSSFDSKTTWTINSGNLTVLSSHLAYSNFTMGLTGNVDLNRFHALTSTVTVSGIKSAAFSITDSLMINGNIADSTNNAGSTIVGLVIENGTLTTNGYDVSSCRLQGTNSTLVANVSDAIKDGYTNALP